MNKKKPKINLKYIRKALKLELIGELKKIDLLNKNLK